jgi:hypothetical protein
MKSITVGTLGLVLISATTPASANGADFALGMVGGLVGMALAQQHPYVAYPYRTNHYHHVRTASVPSHPVALPVTTMTVARDTPRVIRTFMNCKTGHDTTTAKVDSGSITARKSTRFVCGDPDHEVTEFVYQSRAGFVEADQITYYENGRPNRLKKTTSMTQCLPSKRILLRFTSPTALNEPIGVFGTAIPAVGMLP